MTNNRRTTTRAPTTPRPTNDNTPSQPAALLTIERAIADNIDPAQLYMTADHNDRRTGHRMQRQAHNLRAVADKMVLLGFGRDGGKKVAA